ncbi:hypothetical protein SAMN05216456_3175 [Devosia crocina]|uniref:Uncharacterized protein n=1 Tax=Devosia crocina TaxID=429728 RepID=A0A1I7NTG8_9HYPH|nr:hypothetical protein [Devosia crocina]SFV37933.1 hypothetical protein SAMN05216456_3175 [Devosia crocina]
MNRNVIVAVVVVIAVIAFASFMFTNINQAPDGGMGNTQQDNISADTPEVGDQVGNNDGAVTQP